MTAPVEHSDPSADPACRTCQLEFLIEPFEEGKPGPHVLASLANLRHRGIAVTQGPFGNTVSGNCETIKNAVVAIVESAFQEGASRLLINLTQDAVGDHQDEPPQPGRSASVTGDPSAASHPASDEETHWRETFFGPDRPEDLHGAVARNIGTVEQRLGGKLGDLPREKKQAAVRILDEQGVFLIRKSVDEVASAMDVSRITIYNYLNAIRGD